MDKEKEIEEIVQHACNREGIAKRCPQRIAEALINAGYGNVKRVAIETVERLRDKILSLRFSDIATTQQEYYLGALNDVIYNINNFIEELEIGGRSG